VTLPPPVTTGTTIQTYTDQLGDVWVAKNGVSGGAWKRARDVLYARIYRNAGFSMTIGQAAFPFDTAQDDPYGMFVAPNLKVPIPGLYRYTFLVAYSPTAAGQWCQFISTLNGAQTAFGSLHSGYTNQLTIAVNDVQRCNANDTLGALYGCGTAFTTTTGRADASYGSLNYEGTG
jgi:hypothetical protein